MRGRLAEAKQQFEELDLSAGSDITTIRNYLDPFEPDITKIRVGEAKTAMDRLKATVETLRALNALIKELAEALK
jgi:hypothetical protein